MISNQSSDKDAEIISFKSHNSMNMHSPTIKRFVQESLQVQAAS